MNSTALIRRMQASNGGSRCLCKSYRNSYSSWSHSSGSNNKERPSWSEEWKSLGLGATLVDDSRITNLFFCQMGFGVDQHGGNDATKASIRAVRNAIEFNSIPGVIEAIPGGRHEMLIHVKLGVPALELENASMATMTTMPLDFLQVAKVFPYGRLLPLQVVVGGLSYPTGRLVPELGDHNDLAICVAACVSIGYDNGTGMGHHIYSTKDGL